MSHNNIVPFTPKRPEPSVANDWPCGHVMPARELGPDQNVYEWSHATDSGAVTGEMFCVRCELEQLTRVNERLKQQALVISEILREAGIGPCTLTEGVLELVQQANNGE